MRVRRARRARRARLARRARWFRAVVQGSGSHALPGQRCIVFVQKFKCAKRNGYKHTFGFTHAPFSSFLSSSPTHRPINGVPLFLSHPKPDPILSNFKHPSDRALPKRDQVKMQFNGPTFNRPPVVPELRYPPGVLVERELRVWAISRWRGFVELTRAFLRAGYAHLPRGSPRMFTLNEIRDRGGILLLLTVTFTNPFDARELLGQVFWSAARPSSSPSTTSTPTTRTSSPLQPGCTPFPMTTRRRCEDEDGVEGARAAKVEGRD